MKNNFFATSFKLSLFVALLTTTGCAEYHRRVLESMDSRGSEFTNSLAKEYGDLGTTEENTMFDQCSADYYFQKAILAKEGRCVGPALLERYDIHCDDLPELVTARNRLMLALQAGARQIAPQMTAHTQAHFDCWVEQQAEGWQKDDIALCRSEFYTSIAEVELMLMGGPHKVIPNHSILFDHNSAHLTPEGMHTIDAAAGLVHQHPHHILLIGRTDKIGDLKYNENLSKHRALAVKKEFVHRGVSPHIITIKAAGETPGPQVDQHNRRVDIIFLESK